VANEKVPALKVDPKTMTPEQKRGAEKPTDPVKLLNWWLPTDPDCPEDVIVNASTRPLIIGAPAAIPNDSPRLDVGDRRQGQYYVRQISAAINLGIQRVKDLSIERVRELEKIRQIRSGERPPDWVLEQRKRSEEQKFSGDPKNESETRSLTMSPLQRAAAGLDD
jgi:hypothetical protein